MKRLFCATGLCVFLGVFSCSSGGNNNNNTNNNNTNKQCDSPRDCWKRICPQTDKVDYEECVQKRVNTSLVSGTSENHKPEYLTCTSTYQCSDVATSTLGSGKVQVTLEPSEVRIQWLRLIVLDAIDMDGKAVTCNQLKTTATEKPAFLMSSDLRRYWPARDASQPITAQVLEQQGRILPLLFGTTVVTVPAGKHVVVVQGFCNPKEGGTPTAQTSFQWWLCQEGVEFKAGETNDISVTLDTTQHSTCPPG